MLHTVTQQTKENQWRPCPAQVIVWVGIGVGTLEGVMEHESRGIMGPGFCLSLLQMSRAKSVRGVTEEAW